MPATIDSVFAREVSQLQSEVWLKFITLWKLFGIFMSIVFLGYHILNGRWKQLVYTANYHRGNGRKWRGPSGIRSVGTSLFLHVSLIALSRADSNIIQKVSQVEFWQLLQTSLWFNVWSLSQEHFSRVYKVRETGDAWIWGMHRSMPPQLHQCPILWCGLSIQEIYSHYLGTPLGESSHFHDSKLKKNGAAVIMKTHYSPGV